MFSPFRFYLIRKQATAWLTLGCSLALVAVFAVLVARGFPLSFGSYRPWTRQVRNQSPSVQAADNSETEPSLGGDRSAEPNATRSDQGALNPAGVNAANVPRATLRHSAGDPAASGGKSQAATESDAALFASVERLERRVAAAIGRARESVVALEYTAIDAPTGSRRGATGVVINSRGEVLSVRIDPPAASPAPDVGGKKALIVARDFEGRRHSAHWVAADPETGLTLLRLPQWAVRPIRTAANGPNLGSQVFVVGNPFGMGHSVSRGHVAALDRALELGARQLGGLIQIQAPLYPGDSGGAVVNFHGDWIGLIRSGLARQGRAVASETDPGAPLRHASSTASSSPTFTPVDGALFRPERDTDFGFAIPAPDALWVADQLRAQGRVDRAYLGVRLEPVPVTIGEVSPLAPERPTQPTRPTSPSGQVPGTAPAFAHDTGQRLNSADEGAILREVLADTPASHAGLRPGDGIVALNEHRIRTAHDLTDRLDRIPARTTVQLDVVRGRGPQRQRTSVSLRTASRPDAVQLAGTDSPPATTSTSTAASVSSAPVGVSPEPGVTPAGQHSRPDLQVEAPTAPPTPQPDELRLTLPRAVVDRLEKLERRLEKLEAFPTHTVSPTSPADHPMSAVRTP
jgi:serine protease Do